MSDTKKVEKISPEELHYLETLKKENTIYVLRSENTKLQYENALFKIMRKYNLSETDSIDESSGAIVRRAPPATPAAPLPPPQPPPPPPPSSIPAVTAVPAVELESISSEKAGKVKSKKQDS